MDEEAKHEVDVPPSEVVDGDVANDWSKEDDGVAPEAPPTAAESLDPPLILMIPREVEAVRGFQGFLGSFLMNLMATEPFDLLHIAAFSSYIAARTTTSPDLSHRLLQREIQVILAFQCWRWEARGHSRGLSSPN
ncbi:hypothetical protein J5N97_025810 [Dioscorea zingiberensis]|uniref:Uncharacterized protein n=1 Tax=Dioscorea zingiberensis TaxID=325984 RepID=A0A9D5C0Y9_9LILI|nr:hypothetical protein J5N97_025810 [Dioscorea zingiberensis]